MHVALATVLAETSGDAATGGGLPSLAIFGLFFVGMYFLLIRPQRKRQKEQQALIKSIELGSDVVTIGGLHGTVESLGDDFVDLVVSSDGTVLRFQRQAIARTVSEDDIDDLADDLADDEAGADDAATDDEA